MRPIGEEPPTPGGGGSNTDMDLRGQRRRNETHRSATDPDARLARKGDGQAAVLGYYAHVLLDNRHGLVRNVCATHATGTAEAEAGVLLVLADPMRRPG